MSSQISLSSLNQKDHYEILELPRNCSQEEISESYRKLSLKYHHQKIQLYMNIISKNLEKLMKSFQIQKRKKYLIYMVKKDLKMVL